MLGDFGLRRHCLVALFRRNLRHLLLHPGVGLHLLLEEFVESHMLAIGDVESHCRENRQQQGTNQEGRLPISSNVFPGSNNTPVIRENSLIRAGSGSGAITFSGVISG